jgi:hypothetical protein
MIKFQDISMPNIDLARFLPSLIGFSSLILTAAPSYALTNGSFETDLTNGWEVGGNVTRQTSAFGVTPTNLIYQSLATTFQFSSSAVEPPLQVGVVDGLEDFLGIPLDNPSIFDDPNDPVGGAALEGSVLKQNITVQAGDVLTLDWNFVSNDDANVQFPDYAFILISTLGDLGTVTYNDLYTLSDATLPLPPSNPFAYQTGYLPFTYTFPTSGTYLLGVGGVVDINDFDGNSGVLVDNVVITSSSSQIPEPSSILGVILLGLLGLGRKYIR